MTFSGVQLLLLPGILMRFPISYLIKNFSAFYTLAPLMQGVLIWRRSLRDCLDKANLVKEQNTAEGEHCI